MESQKYPDNDLTALIADYMEKGFLDNIVDMFRHDKSLYRLVSGLITDERFRVRLGITALMEELRDDAGNMQAAVPGLLRLLDHQEPVVRGDAANLLGIAGNISAVPYLEKLLVDTNHDVRLIAEEAIGQVRNKYNT